MHPILQKLAVGDRRTVGYTAEVTAEIENDADLFDVVVEGMLADHPTVPMRAADAVEKASRIRPTLLQHHKHRLIAVIANVQQPKVCWHVALMLPRLDLTKAERAVVIALLKTFLDEQSSILKTNAMQALADLTMQDEALRPQMIPLLQHLTQTGTPAMRARGRMLLVRLNAEDEPY